MECSSGSAEIGTAGPRSLQGSVDRFRIQWFHHSERVEVVLERKLYTQELRGEIRPGRQDLKEWDLHHIVIHVFPVWQNDKLKCGSYSLAGLLIECLRGKSLA